MIALSWLLWLFVIAIQAIIHFCFIGRQNSKPNNNNNSNNNNTASAAVVTNSRGTQNRLNPSKPQQRQEETIQGYPSSHVEFQDHCKIIDENERTSLPTERKGESITSILKHNHGLRRRRIRSDVSLSVSDQNNTKPLIHSISTSTDGYDDNMDDEDYDDVPSDQHHDNASHDCESDLDEEEEWRLALIQRYVQNNPSQESFVSINMLNRSMDSTEEDEGNMMSSAAATTTSTRRTSSVPLVCT